MILEQKLEEMVPERWPRARQSEALIRNRLLFQTVGRYRRLTTSSTEGSYHGK